MDDKDAVEDLSDKVFDTNVGSLLTVSDQLDPQVLEIAINTIDNANRAEFYGFGASGYCRSRRATQVLPLAAIIFWLYGQQMSAISLGADDSVVAVTQSGQNRALLESLSLAREAGATVIGVAPENTPLSKQCSLPIYVNMKEENQAFAPVSSRIAHVVVIGVLATGVARHRKPLLKGHLKELQKSRQALRDINSN